MKTFGTWPDGRPFNKTPGQWHREQQEQKAELNPDVAKARREGSDQVKAALKRIAANGPAAHDYALSLLDTELTIEQIEKIVTKIQPQSGTLLHRPRSAAPVPAPRLATKPEEEEWFQKAKASAEREWAPAMGLPMPQRQLTPEDIALNQSFNEIAMKAAGLVRDPDSGQKRFRGDQIDADLYAKGAEAAKRLWPGR